MTENIEEINQLPPSYTFFTSLFFALIGISLMCYAYSQGFNVEFTTINTYKYMIIGLIIIVGVIGGIMFGANALVQKKILKETLNPSYMVFAYGLITWLATYSVVAGIIVGLMSLV